METGRVTDRGFVFIEPHGVSLQRKGAVGTFQEILTMMKVNQYRGEFTINCYNDEDEDAMCEYSIRVDHHTPEELVGTYITDNLTNASTLQIPLDTFVSGFSKWFQRTQHMFDSNEITTRLHQSVTIHLQRHYCVVEDMIIGYSDEDGDAPSANDGDVVGDEDGDDDVGDVGDVGGVGDDDNVVDVPSANDGDDDDDADDCCICFEQFSSNIQRSCIVPCGHSQLCKSCGSALTTCPMCNGVIDQLVVLF